MPKPTTLATGQINKSDQLDVELHRPAGLTFCQSRPGRLLDQVGGRLDQSRAVELPSQRSGRELSVVHIYVVQARIQDHVEGQVTVDLSAAAAVRVETHEDPPCRVRRPAVNVRRRDRLDIPCDLDRPAHLAQPGIDGHGCGSSGVQVPLVRYTSRGDLCLTSELNRERHATCFSRCRRDACEQQPNGCEDHHHQTDHDRTRTAYKADGNAVNG